MEKILAQLEILRRVLGEIQGASQDGLALEVVPLVKKMDEMHELNMGTSLNIHVSSIPSHNQDLQLCNGSPLLCTLLSPLLSSSSRL